jgi:hypothetical protein
MWSLYLCRRTYQEEVAFYGPGTEEPLTGNSIGWEGQHAIVRIELVLD